MALTLFLTLLLSSLLPSSSFAPFVFVGRGHGVRLDAKGGGDGKDYGVIDVSERPPNPLTPCTQTEIASQRVALQTLETKYSKITSSKKYDASRILGFTEKAERYNSRFAMFFLVVGLLTELWTGVSIPGQVEVLLRAFGVIGL